MCDNNSLSQCKINLPNASEKSCPSIGSFNSSTAIERIGITKDQIGKLRNRGGPLLVNM